jgi:hypothetical protein
MRTSENSVNTKFGELGFSEVQLPNTVRYQGLYAPS